MGYSIEYLPRAVKSLKKLDKGTAARIFEAMDEVATLDDPRSQGKGLTGPLSGLWRYRVGDYRVICDVHDGELVVLVVGVAHRSRVYKRL
ncbi:type II toxin-antitoxin system RelE family toxin [Adlercreutzia muris]|uniref:type II toxin-antitoxin system RelE family toxin n=1 Tax=Adlercreutzia muris TaxID=1796610 RepID=UPI001F58EE94|nr:type II toxin-antitoxin system RelE/ParE family toxin [Adlercreutzia muris]